jgi:hypothetical protein
MRHHTWRDYWSIYANGTGGWFAWNAQRAKRVELVAVGSLTEAETELNRLHSLGKLP